MTFKTLAGIFAGASLALGLTTGAQAATQQLEINPRDTRYSVDDSVLAKYSEQEAYREILGWATGSTKSDYLDDLHDKIELYASRFGCPKELAVAILCAEAQYGNRISWARQDSWQTFEKYTDQKVNNYPNVFDDIPAALSELAIIAKDKKTTEEWLSAYWTGPDGSYNKDSYPGFLDAVGKLYAVLNRYAEANDAKADARKYRQQRDSGSNWGSLAYGDLDNYSSGLKSMPKLASQLMAFPNDEAEYAKVAKHFNKRLSDAEAIVIARAVLTYCKQTENIVDPRLVMSIVAAESRFRPDAVSKVGAMGLGQLMPGTARGHGIKDAFDPIQNLYGCVKYLEREVVRWGERDNYLDLVIASYNAGPGAVKKYGGVPPYKETQNFVKTVKGYYSQLAGKKKK
jgi:soluble lytic murein transglycosylase-like protein